MRRLILVLAMLGMLLVTAMPVLADEAGGKNKKLVAATACVVLWLRARRNNEPARKQS